MFSLKRVRVYTEVLDASNLGGFQETKLPHYLLNKKETGRPRWHRDMIADPFVKLIPFNYKADPPGGGVNSGDPVGLREAESRRRSIRVKWGLKGVNAARLSGRREARGFKSYSAPLAGDVRTDVADVWRKKKMTGDWSMHKRNSASPTCIGQITERSFSSRICSLPGDETLRRLQSSSTSLVYHLASFSFSLQTQHTLLNTHCVCLSVTHTCTQINPAF